MDYESKAMQRMREMKALHAGGWTFVDIGKLTGCGGNTVRNIVAKLMRIEGAPHNAHILCARDSFEIANHGEYAVKQFRHIQFINRMRDGATA